MKFKLTLFILVIFSFVSCSDDDAYGTNSSDRISDTAEDYLNEILDLMEMNSINKNEIEWSSFRQRVYERAGNSQSIEDTYPAISRALLLLEDNHSNYTGTDGTNLFEGNIRCNFQEISEVSTPETVGYVKINEFSGSSNSSAAISFAQDIQNQIISQNNSSTQGWIIDLRGNFGGNMWPMLAGEGHLLGEGIAGYFIDADEIDTPWGYQHQIRDLP